MRVAALHRHEALERVRGDARVVEVEKVKEVQVGVIAHADVAQSGTDAVRDDDLRPEDAPLRAPVKRVANASDLADEARIEA